MIAIVSHNSYTYVDKKLEILPSWLFTWKPIDQLKMTALESTHLCKLLLFEPQ